MDQIEKNNMNATTEATKLAVLQALARLGYSTMVNEDGNVRAWYYGRYLDFIFDHNFVRVWDLYWKTFCPGDEDLPYFKEAVNSTNHHLLATIIYSDSEDKELIFLHSKVDFLFVPELQFPESYLEAQLRELDTIREHFNSHLKARNG